MANKTTAKRESYSVNKMPVNNLHFGSIQHLISSLHSLGVVVGEELYLPVEAIKLLCERYTMGKNKYPNGKNLLNPEYDNQPNWVNGHPYSNLIDSAGRHLLALLTGEIYDTGDIDYCTTEIQMHHSGSFIWNMLTLIYNQLTFQENDLYFMVEDVDKLPTFIQYYEDIMSGTSEVFKESMIELFSLLNNYNILDDLDTSGEIIALLILGVTRVYQNETLVK